MVAEGVLQHSGAFKVRALGFPAGGAAGRLESRRQGERCDLLCG